MPCRLFATAMAAGAPAARRTPPGCRCHSPLRRCTTQGALLLRTIWRVWQQNLLRDRSKLTWPQHDIRSLQDGRPRHRVCDRAGLQRGGSGAARCGVRGARPQAGEQRVYVLRSSCHPACGRAGQPDCWHLGQLVVAQRVAASKSLRNPLLVGHTTAVAGSPMSCYARLMHNRCSTCRCIFTEWRSVHIRGRSPITRSRHRRVDCCTPCTGV